MLEELIETYLATRDRLYSTKVDLGAMNPTMTALDQYEEACDNLLTFIAKHSGTLIAWERQHALQTSPFDELD